MVLVDACTGIGTGTCLRRNSIGGIEVVPAHQGLIEPGSPLLIIEISLDVRREPAGLFEGLRVDFAAVTGEPLGVCA